MTEEVKTNEAPTVSPVEEKALGLGWTPKDEWVAEGKDPDDWKDARTYIREGEMMERITKQSNALDRYKSKIDNLEKSLKMLTDHNLRIAQIERDRAIKELKAQKAEALRDNDADKVVELDEKIQEVKEQTAEAKEAKSEGTQTPDPDAVEWLNDPKNTWYHDDFELHDEADRFFVFKTRKGNLTTKEILKELEKHMQEKYPQKFGKKKATPKVTETDGEAGSRSSTAKKYTSKDLDESELRAVKQWVKSGGAKSVQEYIDDLAATGYFDNRR